MQETGSLGVLHPSQMSNSQGSESLAMLQGGPDDAFIDWSTHSSSRGERPASRTYSTAGSGSRGLLRQSQLGRTQDASVLNQGFLERSRSPRRIVTQVSRTRITRPRAANSRAVKSGGDGSLGALRGRQMDAALSSGSVADQLNMGFLQDSQNDGSLGVMEPALMGSNRSSTLAGEQTRVDMFLSDLEEREYNSLLETQLS